MEILTKIVESSLLIHWTMAGMITIVLNPYHLFVKRKETTMFLHLVCFGFDICTIHICHIHKVIKL